MNNRNIQKETKLNSEDEKLNYLIDHFDLLNKEEQEALIQIMNKKAEKGNIK